MIITLKFFPEIVKISDAFKDCRDYITQLPCLKGVRRYNRKILQKMTIWGWDGCTQGFLVRGRHINFSDFRFFVFLVSRPISLRCDTSLFLLLSKKAHEQNNRPNGSKHSWLVVT